jgi:acetyltransferase-like isoleucine patch superfamily enzyme
VPLWKNLKEIKVSNQKRFYNWQYPNIEDGIPTKYNWVVQNLDNFKLEKYTDIGAFSYINAKYGVVVEENVQIGSHCSVYSISTIDNKSGSVILKNNCKIGSHSTILPGVTVGENSIIGAHSLVNKDIPDNVIAFGVPVQVIKKLDE